MRAYSTLTLLRFMKDHHHHLVRHVYNKVIRLLNEFLLLGQELWLGLEPLYMYYRMQKPSPATQTHAFGSSSPPTCD